METDPTVQQQKQMQHSSINTSRTSPHQRPAEQLPAHRTTGGGSAARIATTAAVSAMSTRAAPPTAATRATVLASSQRSAFTNPQD